MKMRKASTTYQQIFEWAKDRGMRNTEAQQKGDLAPFGFSLSKFLVLKSIRKELGLEHVEQFFYGAAPLSQSTRDYFAKLNMPVVGLYGLSESSGGSTFQEFPQAKLDKVG
jgi:long-chain-fatty-acid--CoA ligase ACSBG